MVIGGAAQVAINNMHNNSATGSAIGYLAGFLLVTIILLYYLIKDVNKRYKIKVKTFKVNK